MYELPKFDPNSRKGQVGKVLVVGGSPHYYGAPILTALGVEAGGADLIWLYLPKNNADIAKHYSLNFFINYFKKPYLSLDDLDHITEITNHVDTVVIGNGVGILDETKAVIFELVSKINKPMILDAEALFPKILEINFDNKDIIVTPHKAEFKRLFNVDFSPESIKEMAKKYKIAILVKGHIDYIADKDNLIENSTGCAQMRVRGYW